MPLLVQWEKKCASLEAETGEQPATSSHIRNAIKRGVEPKQEKWVARSLYPKVSTGQLYFVFDLSFYNISKVLVKNFSFKVVPYSYRQVTHLQD